MNRIPFVQGSMAATALALTLIPALADAQSRVQYGRITNVVATTMNNQSAQTVGTLIGGGVGLASGSGQSCSNRALRTLGGAAAGRGISGSGPRSGSGSRRGSCERLRTGPACRCRGCADLTGPAARRWWKLPSPAPRRACTSGSSRIFALPAGPPASSRTGCRYRTSSQGDLGGGFSTLAEAAWQDSTEAAISARAWYAQLAYTAKALPWTPSLLYRYASASGDRSDTPTREAFDAPLSSGPDEWVQGVNFKKVVTNTNLNSHCVRLNAGPDQRLNFTLDYYYLWVAVPLPTEQSTYGNELDLIVRWAISKQLFFLSVAGVVWPGDVIKAQTQGAARPWSTIQASLFWAF